MKIISHAGAKGLAAANTATSIKLADTCVVDYIEFDLQFTVDNNTVLYHGSKYQGKKISNLNRWQLPRNLDNLESALNAIKRSVPLIELKQPNSASKLLATVDERPLAVASFHLENVKQLQKNRHIETFILQRAHPFGLFKKCQGNNFSGMGINKNWLILVPFLYKKCNKNHRKLFIYTLNSQMVAKLLTKYYPEIYICTDRPDKLLR